MLKTMKRLTVSFFLAVFILNSVVLPATDTNVVQVEAATLTGKVTSSILNIRVAKSTKSKRIVQLKRGKKLEVLTTGSKWVKIRVDGKVGYTQGQYITTSRGGRACDKDGKPSSKGQAVANYARRFVGNPYKWGGTSLTRGADCSGFVMSVYRHFGKKLPHSSYSLRSVGRKVGSLSKARPGDIICYSGHVAIYLGNNKIVHASNKKTGIKISNNARYRRIVTIRRIF